MDPILLLKAALLGLLEGATEFIPVSSTGHLLLAQRFIGFSLPGKTFEVLIQLGAILAILTVYFAKLLRLAKDLPRDRDVQRFALGVILAFLPAMVVGALAHSFIKEVLFDPLIVCITLIFGGFILLVVDRMALQPRYTDAMGFPLPMYLAIGAVQCLAMVPGVSRSGATIVGALLMGSDKRSAAEFSFFLAMPTMAGAFAYDLLKNYKLLSLEDGILIGVGFLFAFASGVLVVRSLLDYVSRRGFGFFAWWRIIVGVAGLAGLALIA